MEWVLFELCTVAHMADWLQKYSWISMDSAVSGYEIEIGYDKISGR